MRKIVATEQIAFSAARLQADFRDTGGLVADHCNKVSDAVE